MTTDTSNQNVVHYDFIEHNTQKVLGNMKVKSSIASKNGWTTTENLKTILAGGLSKGLEFSFPCQGATPLSSGNDDGVLEPVDGAPYGSSNGDEIDIGCIIGRISGFSNNNQLMALTFDPDGLGDLGNGHSATTMLNDAKEDCIGFKQGGEGDEHGDKYIYIGRWIRRK